MYEGKITLLGLVQEFVCVGLQQEVKVPSRPYMSMCVNRVARVVCVLCL